MAGHCVGDPFVFAIAADDDDLVRQAAIAKCRRDRPHEVRDRLGGGTQVDDERDDDVHECIILAVAVATSLQLTTTPVSRCTTRLNNRCPRKDSMISRGIS